MEVKGSTFLGSCLVATLSLLLVRRSPLAGQPGVNLREWTSSDGRLSAIAVKGVSVTDEWVDMLLAMASANREIRGVPSDILAELSLRISLVPGLADDVDGAAYPSTGVIALPLPAAQQWSVEHLAKVYRHELAHVAMWRVLSTGLLPHWLREGFAEWASGGLTCRQDAQLRLDVAGRSRQGLPLPRLDEELERTPLTYAYYATALEYVEQATSGDVSSGKWLALIAEYGVGPILRDLGGLEARWHSYLTTTYGEGHFGRGCRPGNP